MSVHDRGLLGLCVFSTHPSTPAPRPRNLPASLFHLFNSSAFFRTWCGPPISQKTLPTPLSLSADWGQHHPCHQTDVTLLNSFTGFLPAGSIAPWCLSHYSLRVFLKPWTLPMAGEVTALTKGIHPSMFTTLPFIHLERVSIDHTKETRNDPRPDVLVSPQSISNLGPCPWRPGSRCKPCGGCAQATVQLCAQSIWAHPCSDVRWSRIILNDSNT